MPENDQARRRKRVVSFLSLALKIQAAGINRRLKEDMVAQDPTLVAADLKRISLFEPEVSDQAFHAFEHYVERQVAVARLCDRAGHRAAKRRGCPGKAHPIGARPGRSRA